MSGRNSGLKIVVAGNATLDAHLEGIVRIEQPNRVVVTSVDNSYYFKRVFEIEDGPITPGYKHRVKIDITAYPRGLEDYIRGLKNQLMPGGGDINTSTSLMNRADFDSDISIIFLDMSQRETLLVTHLNQLGIQHHFFNYRPVPVNAIIGGRDDKLILKGPMLPREKLRDEDKGVIDRLVEDVQGVVINSAKDESFVDALISSAERRDIPLYFMVTPSLDKDFVFTRVLPAGITITSHEDLAKLHGHDPLSYNKDQLFDMAVQYARQFRKDGFDRYGTFVTLGSNGVLYFDGKTYLSHTRLKEDQAELVFNSASSRFGSTNGAGDTFAGAVAMNYLETKGFSIDEIAKRASKAAIRHIGYEGPIQSSSFVTRTL